MGSFVGDTVLTSPVWNWGPKYIEITQQIMEGTYEPESYWGGMGDGIVELAPFSDRVSEDTIQMVEEWREAIISGETEVFCGPINGADGELLVAEGECLDDAQMLSMSCFVEGVQGEAPQTTESCFSTE